MNALKSRLTTRASVKVEHLAAPFSVVAPEQAVLLRKILWGMVESRRRLRRKMASGMVANGGDHRAI